MKFARNWQSVLVMQLINAGVWGFAALSYAAPLDRLDFQSDLLTPIHDPRPLRQPSNFDAELESQPQSRIVAFDIQHYDLHIAVDPRSKMITGTNRVVFRSARAGLGEISLDAIDMRINSVKAADGSDLQFLYDGEVITIALRQPLNAGQTSEVTVDYVAAMSQSFFLTGPDITKPQRKTAGYTYTQPEGSSEWYPCLDRPADKATVELTASVPAGYRLLSNGATVTFDDRSEGTSTFSYRMEEPIATYLVSLAVGDYQVLPMGDYRGKPLALWAPTDLVDRMAYDTGRTVAMMEAFRRFTGIEYPFASYTQAVAEVAGSSMEHQTATTMGGNRITGDRSGESVVAHELAHQWFGDWVTCRTWGEIWLNESFASYLPYVFFVDENDGERALKQLDGWRATYFNEARSYTHALSQPDPDMSQIFDNHAYSKGTMVLHMLRQIANEMPIVDGEHQDGEETFTVALRYYLQTNGRKTVTSTNLQAALEHVTGQSWQITFDQWVRSAGHPVLNATYTYEQNSLVLNIEQQQATRTDKRWRTFSFPLTVEVILETGETALYTVQVYDELRSFTLPLPAAPKAVVLDPSWVLPAEITLTQSPNAWRDVLRYSPLATSRLRAERLLAPTVVGSVNADIVDLLLADRSAYVRTDALQTLSANIENAPHIRAIWQQLRTSRDNLDVIALGSLALTESWLVRNAPTLMTDIVPADEAGWQRRYFAADLVTERAAMLEILKSLSLDRAQQFAIQRLSEVQWATADRTNLINVLINPITMTSAPYIEAALNEQTRTSRTYLNSILNSITRSNYDRPALVPALLAGSSSHPDLGVRTAFVNALGAQASSKATICPVLIDLTRTGLAAARPASYADVRGAAFAAQVSLSCGGL